MTDPPPASMVIAAILLVVTAALFAALDAALSRISSVRAGELAERGRRGGPSLVLITAGSATTVAVMTFVRVVCEVVAAILVTLATVSLVDGTWQQLGVAAAVMIVVSFVLVGVTPRTLGRQHAESFALIGARPLLAVVRLLGPLARLLVAVGSAVTPGRVPRDGPFASEAELRALLDLAGENRVIEASEQRMLHSVFEFGDTVAREVMVPRTDMVTIDDHQVVRQALSLFLRSGFSRIPVVGAGPDDVRGMLYLKDVTRKAFRDLADGQSAPVTAVMRPVAFVPETKPVAELLRQMQREQNHVALVVDEYGGTAGLVTIEDLLEEIVGEIADEYDRELEPVERLGDGSVRVRASLPVDEFGELFGRELDDEEVDTVGGLLAKLVGRVPIPGARAELDGLELTAERLAGRRHRIATIVVRDQRSASGATREPDGPEDGAGDDAHLTAALHGPHHNGPALHGPHHNGPALHGPHHNGPDHHGPDHHGSADRHPV
ncbi:MAG: hemolysin family protein [Angustibacter sp.]